MKRAGWARSVVFALALGSFAACGGASRVPEYDYAGEPDPRHIEYVIGAADLLEVHVWRHQELSSTVRVRPDGTVTIPLVGDVEAAGETPSRLERLIRNRLDSWLQEPPVVSVAVQEVNSYRFTVSGHVQSEGVFQLGRYTTVVEAIAMAGGFTRYAERDEVFVIRRAESGDVRKIPINFIALAKGRHLEMNIMLLPGDTVVVP